MTKKLRMVTTVILVLAMIFICCACGEKQDSVDVKSSEASTMYDREGVSEPSVVKTYEPIDPEVELGENEYITMVKYYEMSDGTRRTDDYTYRYRLEITGRMGEANKDSTFVFLSNTKDITFDQAWKASGFSSNMNDYFKEEDAKFVAMKYSHYEDGEPAVEGCYDDPNNPLAEQTYRVGEPRYE